jgi:hypothetical protein
MMAALATSDDSDANQDERDSAEGRLDLCLAVLRERGIQITLTAPSTARPTTSDQSGLNGPHGAR